MPAHVERVDYVTFDFASTATREVPLTCNLQFTAQSPLDREAAKTTRGILVHFQAKAAEGAEEQVHLTVETRVVFAFEDGAELPDEQSFLDAYYPTAYRSFRERTVKTLEVMEITGFSLPETLSL